MQTGIGGSDHSPRDALHVPPAPERVPALMHDLIDYLNRDDVPVMVQAAIAHAQFESIDAFTDGNGRIGRALVSAVLAAAGATKNAVIPLASGLLAMPRDDDFAALGEYRSGHPTPLIHLFCMVSARAAAICSRESIAHIKALPGEWNAKLRPRGGSAVAALIPAFARPSRDGSRRDRAALRIVGAADIPSHKQVERGGEPIHHITGCKRDRVC